MTIGGEYAAGIVQSNEEDGGRCIGVFGVSVIRAIRDSNSRLGSSRILNNTCCYALVLYLVAAVAVVLLAYHSAFLTSLPVLSFDHILPVPPSLSTTMAEMLLDDMHARRAELFTVICFVERGGVMHPHSKGDEVVARPPKTSLSCVGERAASSELRNTEKALLPVSPTAEEMERSRRRHLHPQPLLWRLASHEVSAQPAMTQRHLDLFITARVPSPPLRRHRRQYKHRSHVGALPPLPVVPAQWRNEQLPRFQTSWLWR